MQRINDKNVKSLCKNNPSILAPNYHRNDVKEGILHLGIGAFHRAHQAFYTEAVLNSSGGNWAIVGCSLRSASVKNQLAEQDGLYTVVERGSEGEKFQIIGAVKSVLVGPESPEQLVKKMADPAIKIVSLTVTEKGYCHDPATGDLNMLHPDIVHDLKNLSTPKSAVGFIVAALNARKNANVQSFTALSCDNLPNNGQLLEKMVKTFSENIDVGLALWIAENTTFPSTMIDRIVPATTDSDRVELEKNLGYCDEGMVVTEPFTQWVIEDNFCNDRPAWEEVGALLVKDVEAFEKMKLRLLNGAHSMLAYCGYMSGFETISDVMEEPALIELCRVFMNREAGETVTAPTGFDVKYYKHELRDRFANPALKHRTWQIAMDGSQKLPQRLLDTLRDQLKAEGHIEMLCLAVAAWMRFVSGVDEAGEDIDVQDPLAKKLRQCHDRNENNPEAIVKEILSLDEIFSDDLPKSEEFVAGVTYWLKKFYQKGTLNSIRLRFTD